MDAIAEIKRLYHETTKATIQRDLTRAVVLLKSLGSEEERERAAVYMDGLSQMRSEWGVRPPAPAKGAKTTGTTKGARPTGTAKGRKPTGAAKKPRPRA